MSKSPLQQVEHLISTLSEPGLMSTEEALEFLESVIESVSSFADALRSDLELTYAKMYQDADAAGEHEDFFDELRHDNETGWDERGMD